MSDQPLFLAFAIIDTILPKIQLSSSCNTCNPQTELVVIAIRKESMDHKSLMDIRYQRHLWMENEIKSAVNITRKAVIKFIDLSANIPILPAEEKFAIDDANNAVLDLKHKHIRGVKVLVY